MVSLSSSELMNRLDLLCSSLRIEPTSGLDSTSAVALMDVLRELAMRGKTIITSIHQPSSQIFHSFDQLILLADGKTIFMVNNPSLPFTLFNTFFHRSFIYSRVNPRTHYLISLPSVIMRLHSTIQQIT